MEELVEEEEVALQQDKWCSVVAQQMLVGHFPVKIHLDTLQWLDSANSIFKMTPHAHSSEAVAHED